MTSLLTLLPVLCLVAIAAGHMGDKLTSVCAHSRNFKRPGPAPRYRRSDPLARAKRSDPDCSSEYRSADGTCNNLANPSWGSTDQVYRRLLDPVYDDGSMTPRQKAVSGVDLPSPRDISVTVHDFDRNRLHQRGSVMLMEWGQFLAHDLVGTPVEEVPENHPCCYDDLVINNLKHPDVDLGLPCNPIIISAGDRYFTNVSTRCMESVRSYPVTDTKGIRQQMNERTAYIDGDQVYGTSTDQMTSLRTLTGGKLKVAGDDDLPKSDDNYCVLDEGDDPNVVYCMEAGDGRVNVYPGLGALHTVFMRFHNYVATALSVKYSDNVEYNDEKLFQEARKIVIAVLQSITYREYLPMILGSSAMTTYDLNTAFSYNASCDATIYNVFGAAAFRFGHSMVPDNLTINGTEEPSVKLYDHPSFVLQNLDSVLSGLASKQAERADRWYSEGITDQLFELEPQHGYDIASLNIQRGRDHGLPAYNNWRVSCGLDSLASLDALQADRRFSDVYSDVNDVDLYSGALDEVHVDQGSVGPTYACLLGKQFGPTRNCDRFWWEADDTFSNNRQRREIRRSKLSHIICLTTEVANIQEHVFRVVDTETNPLKTCEELKSEAIDINEF